MKILLFLLALIPVNNTPKYDLAVSSAGLYSAYNNKHDINHKMADKKYKDKLLLVNGYFGGSSSSKNSLILELTKYKDHTGYDFVVAEMTEITKDIIKLKWSDYMVVRCVGNGYITIKGNVPLLRECVLVR